VVAHYRMDAERGLQGGERLEDQLALLPGRKWGRTQMLGLEDLDGTMAQVTDDAPVILLDHEPDIFPRVPERVSLTLSGHT
ncbi:hypothetical protein AB9F34_34445, partial [Rhizobium leguminosarum]